MSEKGWLLFFYGFMLALSLKNLKKTYKNGFYALKGINLDIQEGDFFALLGPNGAGKTTLVGILSTLVNKDQGTVTVFKEDLDRNPANVKSYLGIVPQEFNFAMFDSLEQILVSQGGFYGLPHALAKQRAEKYLKELGLWKQRHLQARMLSGGMKRRLMIARALVHEPKLLILDEPTTGVDIQMRELIWVFLAKINQQGMTIILTTHYLEEAENLCRTIAIIDQGIIIENTKMSTLLTHLCSETFVLYLQNPMPDSFNLGDFGYRIIDKETLEVDLHHSQNLTDLFNVLANNAIVISRMKNKRNRLEELFIRLIAGKQEKNNAT
jgi:ABC-2 type transport system ATP-binding protein